MSHAREDSATYDARTASELRRARITGRALPLLGDDIDTDRIIPARFLRSVVFEGLGEHAFADDRAALRAQGGLHPFDDPARAGASLLVVGHHFGCGSSREHAPQALYRRGLRAIVGGSFAEIFFGNCVSVGLPCAQLSPADLARVFALTSQDASLELSLDLTRRELEVGAERFPVSLPEAARVAWVEGTWDSTAELASAAEETRRVARSLPYMNEFLTETVD
ncbi:MAG: isopropylmalate isomerase [Polyangiaceae bacterium]|nr:isopropylmalate isomerase [Polyangiaceae bacterium]MCW5789754.1 isopropylmalate isomerase [Polyangiaceae bacterium]